MNFFNNLKNRVVNVVDNAKTRGQKIRTRAEAVINVATAKHQGAPKQPVTHQNLFSAKHPVINKTNVGGKRKSRKSRKSRNSREMRYRIER